MSKGRALRVLLKEKRFITSTANLKWHERKSKEGTRAQLPEARDEG